MSADGWNGRSKVHFFNDPPRAEVTGYVFLDSAHMLANARRSDW